MTREEIKKQWLYDSSVAADNAMRRLEDLDKESKLNTIDSEKEYRIIIPHSFTESRQIIVKGRDIIELIKKNQ